MKEEHCEQEHCEQEQLDIIDMLYLFGHKALGLSEIEALEIDPMYRYELYHGG